MLLAKEAHGFFLNLNLGRALNTCGVNMFFFNILHGCFTGTGAGANKESLLNTVAIIKPRQNIAKCEPCAIFMDYTVHTMDV